MHVRNVKHPNASGDKLDTRQLKKSKPNSQPLSIYPILTFPTEKITYILDLFKQGDLVFGLFEPRDIIASILEKKFDFVVANDLNRDVVEPVTTNKKSVNFTGRKLQYFNFLKKFRLYLIKQPSKPIPAIKDNWVVSGAFRRACKILLINRDPERQYKSHVITQGVKWERVFDKSDIGVTNSELRAAYRDFKKYGRNPFILFYNKKNELSQKAPWEEKETSHYFEAYEKKRKSRT